MNKFIKKVVLAFITVVATAMISNVVCADPNDWQGKRVVNPAEGNGLTLEGVGGENSVDYVGHQFPQGYILPYPDVVRVHQYNGATPLGGNFYMKIPLTDQMRDAASQYLGVDRAQLQQDLVVVINDPSPQARDHSTPMLLRPQWSFAGVVPEIGVDHAAYPIQTPATPHNIFNIYASVDTDARVFGPMDGLVANLVRSHSDVSFHDIWIPPYTDDDGHYHPGYWTGAISPDELPLGFPNDGRNRAVLSFVDFNAGLLGQINGAPVAARTLLKQLTLNVVLSDAAWNSFIDRMNRHNVIGDILLNMYRDNYISVEVMHYLLGFDMPMLNPYKQNVQPLAIVPAPLREAAAPYTAEEPAPTFVPPHTANEPFVPPHISPAPVVAETVSVLPQIVTTPQRPSSSITPPWSMSSGIPNLPLDEETLEVFRVYNPNDGMHHYTMNKKEVAALVALGWRDEGVAFRCSSADGVPVYRLYNPNSGIHHFTVNANEKDALVAAGWQYEGIAWYARAQGTVPVYRIYNPTNGEHVWTTNYAEVENAVAHGWNNEGIAWYIV